MTWSPEVFIRESEQEIVDGGSRSFWGEPFDSWRAGNLVGTPEQVCEKIRTYQELGLGGVMAWPADFPDTRTVDLFGRQVIPEFR
jgi:alkanesulfonate monooxygenase SsuD/methylene tetrahydromethanopterin reductase-like flavin-dependent oxidoreductase (luciferase family)